VELVDHVVGMDQEPPEMTVGAAPDDDTGVEAGSRAEPDADVDPLDVEVPELEVTELEVA
jgi:hypothetical protein